MSDEILRQMIEQNQMRFQEMEDRFEQLMGAVLKMKDDLKPVPPAAATPPPPPPEPTPEETHLPHSHAQSPPPHSRLMPKVAKPPIFDGTMEDTVPFVQALIIYVNSRPYEFDTETSKIMWSLSYIRGGKAQFWKDEAVRQIFEGERPFKDFRHFIQCVGSEFGDQDKRATAIAKIKTMRQTGTADELVLNFRLYASQTGFNDDVRAH